MITVKHVRESGVVFVSGDVCRDEVGDEYANDLARRANSGDNDWDDDEMISFAERDNTSGAMPCCDALIVDVIMEDGETSTGRADTYDWVIVNMCWSIITWKPSMKNWKAQDVELDTKARLLGYMENLEIAMANIKKEIEAMK
jgi:hypothetical protein